LVAEQKYTRKINTKADIWAFAIVMVEMKSGISPYSENAWTDEPYQANVMQSHFPDKVVDILNKCFDMDPAKRPTAACLLQVFTACKV
jgi:serine/threonine protein kinase